MKKESLLYLAQLRYLMSSIYGHGNINDQWTGVDFKDGNVELTFISTTMDPYHDAAPKIKDTLGDLTGFTVTDAEFAGENIRADDQTLPYRPAAIIHGGSAYVPGRMQKVIFSESALPYAVLKVAEKYITQCQDYMKNPASPRSKPFEVKDHILSAVAQLQAALDPENIKKANAIDVIPGKPLMDAVKDRVRVYPTIRSTPYVDKPFLVEFTEPYSTKTPEGHRNAENMKNLLALGDLTETKYSWALSVPCAPEIVSSLSIALEALKKRYKEEYKAASANIDRGNTGPKVT